ncbi:MAG: OsmC family protein [Rhodospirillales bacterium]|nr:OsmC family protein [Rhodospirillales bacterium]MDE2197702.1 OsmC family protein [Rhodospirillales bacterium]MDE2576077.1 OsmC family protein [Rhodospirillales bacterium]
MSVEAVALVSGNANVPYGQDIAVRQHRLLADEPTELGGLDSAPNPHELVQGALGACTAITLRMYAARHGWKIDQLTVEVGHEMVTGPAGGKIDRFTRRITVAGALDDGQRARLLAIAEKCPVSQTLKRGNEVISELA